MSTATLTRPDPPATTAAAIVVAGFTEADRRSLLDDAQLAATGEAVEVIAAGDPEEIRRLAGEGRIAVLCLGPELAGADASALLVGLVQADPEYRGQNVVLAAGTQLEPFQDLVNADQIFYLTQKPPPIREVAPILASALRHYQSQRAAADDDDDRAWATHRVMQLTQSVAHETSLDAMTARTVEVICELAVAERAAVLLYEPSTETLWSPAPTHGEERRESTAAGLVSYALRTRSPVRVEAVGEDPRYDAEADNEKGPADDRLLAVPVVEATGERVWAVLVALRTVERPPFTDAELRDLELLAEQTAPFFGRLLRQAELEERAAERHGVLGTEAGQIFRAEALEHHLGGIEDKGHVLQISPAWTPWAFRVLLIVGVAAVLFSILFPVHEWASGPALVRLYGRTEVTARSSGTVVEVEVEAGERVAEGDLLVRLYGAQEAADLDRLRSEFEIALVNRLRDPTDPGAEAALVSLGAQKRRAERLLEERSVRAPHAGVVGDLRARPGQFLTQGQTILFLENGQAGDLGIEALLPGQYRPQLEVGMSLRFEVSGYQYAYQELVVSAVGDEVVGPAEARRILGPLGDAVPIAGSVVFVYARLPERHFESGDRLFPFHDGMQGTVEVRVRSEPILLTLVPGLKAILPDSR